MTSAGEPSFPLAYCCRGSKLDPSDHLCDEGADEKLSVNVLAGDRSVPRQTRLSELAATAVPLLHSAVATTSPSRSDLATG